ANTRAGARPERGPGRSDRPGARPGTHALRTRGRKDPRPAHDTARRLRPQFAELADRRSARGALPGIPRPQPILGGPRGHREALDTLRSPTGAGLRSG